MKRLICFCILSIVPTLALAGARLTGIRYWTAPDHTRIVLDLNASTNYKVSTRKAPERVVIDIPGASFRCETDPRAIDDSLIHRLRCNRLKRGAQVVLDLKSEYRYKYFALDAIPGQKPPRIVVDIFPGDRQLASGALEPASPGRPASSPFGREVVVVVDAGHGGEDPGATYRGLREKQITMDIARRMKRALEARPGYRAVLTRDGDYTMSLARRRELADRALGDVLISIHCNTAPNRQAGGTETFYLSTRGASSRRAQALADLENRADLVGGIHPAAGSSEFKIVLDEQLKAVLRRSYLLASTLHRRSYKGTSLSSRGVKRANFAVCKMVSMPAVLVEVGFLSNTTDREVLGSKAGRQRVADWLAASVDAYFQRYPSTLHDPLFSRREKLVYQVKRGDNLSRIAKRYNVTVADLVRTNGIKRADHLKVGQRLIIVPAESQAVVHRVRRGDTLSGIAKRYGVSVSALTETNRMTKKDLLFPGQELVIRSPASRGGGG